MRITKRQLQMIIKEELSNILEESQMPRQEKTISIDWSTINLTDEETRLLMNAFESTWTRGQGRRLLVPGRELTREYVRVLMLSIERVMGFWNHEGLDSLYEALLTAGENAGWTAP